MRATTMFVACVALAVALFTAGGSATDVAVPNPLSKTIYLPTDYVKFFAVGKCTIPKIALDGSSDPTLNEAKAATHITKLISAASELDRTGLSFGIMADGINLAVGTSAAGALHGLTNLKTFIDDATATHGNEFDPNLHYVLGTTQLNTLAEAHVPLFNENRNTTLKLFTRYWQPAYNYSVTVVDQNEHKTKIINLDASALINSFNNGCQKTVGTNKSIDIPTTKCGQTEQLDERIAWMRREFTASAVVPATGGLPTHPNVVVVMDKCIVNVADQATAVTTGDFGFEVLRSRLLPLLDTLLPSAVICADSDVTQVVDNTDAKYPIVQVGGCEDSSTLVNITNAHLNKRFTPGSMDIKYKSNDPNIAVFRFSESGGGRFKIVGLDIDDGYEVEYAADLPLAHGYTPPPEESEGISTTLIVLICLCVFVVLAVGGAFGTYMYKKRQETYKTFN